MPSDEDLRRITHNMPVPREEDVEVEGEAQEPEPVEVKEDLGEPCPTGVGGSYVKRGGKLYRKK